MRVKIPVPLHLCGGQGQLLGVSSLHYMGFRNGTHEACAARNFTHEPSYLPQNFISNGSYSSRKSHCPVGVGLQKQPMCSVFTEALGVWTWVVRLELFPWPNIFFNKRKYYMELSANSSWGTWICNWVLLCCVPLPLTLRCLLSCYLKALVTLVGYYSHEYNKTAKIVWFKYK